MSLLLLPHVKRSPSLCFTEYYALEKQAGAARSGVSACGALLEYETLELRVQPPSVEVASRGDSTTVSVFSANRAGTLVEVVQHFTELGLNVKSARISSDGGWFVDEFEVTESNGSRVKDARKLQSITRMLDVHQREASLATSNADDTDDSQVETTVFELAGEDCAGLLADVTHLLTTNGCNVRSAAVWTYHGRVAFVLSVTEKGQPIADSVKLQRLRQILFSLMDHNGEGIVNIKRVRGEVHHDRRLHQMMLAEEVKAWDRRVAASAADPGAAAAVLPAAEDACCAERPAGAPAADPDAAPCFSGRGAAPGALARGAAAAGGAAAAAPQASPTDSASSLHGLLCAGSDAAMLYRCGLRARLPRTYKALGSPKHSKPEVDIKPCMQTGYWIISVICKDRNKLLFDTVCTLADLDYDVFHATVDNRSGIAEQEYFVRPRFGEGFDAARAAKLAALLESSIQRRFPKGLKVHVHSVDRFGCLAALARVLKLANLTVTRAKVKTYAVNNSSGHTFYVMDAGGGPPDRGAVEAACREVGGQLVDCPEGGGRPSLPLSHSGGSAKFSFSFLNRQWTQGWGGAASPGSSYGST